MVLLLVPLGERIDSNAECFEAVGFDHHGDDTGIRFIEKALLQLLQYVQLHIFVTAVVNQQQTKLDRFLSHAPVLPRMRDTKNTQKESADNLPTNCWLRLSRLTTKILEKEESGKCRNTASLPTHSTSGFASRSHHAG
jgi:hypothetical protein